MTPVDREVIKEYLGDNTTEVKDSITTAKQEILAKVKEAADAGSSFGGVQTFTEDGTFTVPAGVTKILVTACGGGASCSYRKVGTQTISGGQGGACVYKKAFQVTPGQKISITVGKGGISGTGVGCVAGSPTVIGNLITLPGGHSTTSSDITATEPNEGAGIGGTNNVYMNGQDGIIGKGGLGAYYGGSTTYSSTGGGGSLGNGASSAAKTTGYPGSKAGYGGGGAPSSVDEVRNGGDGIVIIEW